MSEIPKPIKGRDGKELHWNRELGGYEQHVPTQQAIESTGMTREEHEAANAIHKENAKADPVPVDEAPKKPPSRLKKSEKIVAASGEPTADEATSGE